MDSNKLNTLAAKHLLRRGLENGVITPTQVLVANQLGPGTFIGAGGFVGRSCKYCCGPDKPRGNIALPLHEMHSLDVCEICYEIHEAWLDEE